LELGSALWSECRYQISIAVILLSWHSETNGNPTSEFLRTAMATAQDYRDYAMECMGWARTANSDQERRIFRQMAATWWNIGRLTEQGKSLENLEVVFPVGEVASRDDTDPGDQQVA
jgi:hypothetical protein